MESDDFTATASARMSALFARRDDAGLSPAEHAELAHLVDAWQHAYTRLLPVPEGWTPPEPTEALVRTALADAGHPADEEQVAMVMRTVRRGDGTR